MLDSTRLPSLLALLSLTAVAVAQGTPLQELKVRELTTFKDGHAFVLRAGDARLGSDGRIALDDLPSPVLGTFWPAVTGGNATLRAVTAARHRVTLDRTALDLRQLILANVGADVVVREKGDLRYQARILGIPTRTPQEVEAGAPRGADPALSERGDLVLLRTDTARKDTSAERVTDRGTRVVRMDQIVDLTFLGEPKGSFADEQLRNRLLLDVDLKGEKPATVPVAITWMERGFRWVPGYRIVIDGKGGATLRLQATLVNDLVDLEDATVHLVVGVPSFLAKDQLDPISLQGTAAAIAARVGPGQAMDLGNNAMVANFFNQNVATTAPVAVASDTGPELLDSRKEEDLFVFTVRNVSLKRHARMVVTVAEFTAPYRDVWRLDVPIAPPQEAWNQVPQQHGELERLLAAPKVMHKIRLDNTGKAPFTTAPALVLLGERVLAQGLMTYTPAGQSCDVALTTAVDVLVRKSEREIGRTNNAVRWNDHTFTRVDLEGTLALRNRRSQAVEVEVVRHIIGKMTTVGGGGSMEQVNIHEDTSFLPESRDGRGPVWSYFGWPSWWHDLNGVGRARWTVKIEPGQEVELGCAWQYWWR